MKLSGSTQLGRGVYSGSLAKRAKKRGKATLQSFLEKKNVLELSPEMLDDIISHYYTPKARDGKPLLGFGIVSVRDAESEKRRVKRTPIIPDNPNHVDIVLPCDCIDCRDRQKRHAQKLADASRWVSVAVTSE